MVTNYVGLATTPHDPAIAIVDHTGKVVFAEAAERYLQNKRGWCSPPDDFLRIEKLLEQYCVPGCNLVIANSWQTTFFEKLRMSVEGAQGNALKANIGEKHFYHFKACVAYLNSGHGANTENHFRAHNPNAKVSRREYNHHLTHAAAACYSSPFHEAVCLVIDGFGENTNVTAYHFTNSKFQILSDKISTGSLGEFYGMICELCGFEPSHGEEWKVMGLAPYGKYDENYYQILRQAIIVDDITLIAGIPQPKLVKQLEQAGWQTGEPAINYADLAFTGQMIFSEIMRLLINNLYAKGLSDNLVLAGGCALNSAYIGTIEQQTNFKANTYVFCAPADDGNAVGAALLAYYEDNPHHTYHPTLQTPYLGSYLDAKKLNFLKEYSHLNPITFTTEHELVKSVAQKLAQGKIIGWAQGRAEFGPRALGNRSILADPRRASIKNIINSKVKFREAFRPFAPSILPEFGDEYFEHYRDTPYMERALKFKMHVRDKVPGVVHIDGTGRLQTVHREWNERFYLLIQSFYELTEVPMLLNTSFNIMGKPIVHSVEDAVAVFLTSGIDLLVIDTCVFDKDLFRTCNNNGLNE